MDYGVCKLDQVESKHILNSVSPLHGFFVIVYLNKYKSVRNKWISLHTHGVNYGVYKLEDYTREVGTADLSETPKWGSCCSCRPITCHSVFSSVFVMPTAISA